MMDVTPWQSATPLPPKLLGADSLQIAALPLEHPTANGCCNLAECKYEVHFAGTTRFTAQCPYCWTPILFTFQNDCCKVRGFLDYYVPNGEGELPLFREPCPFCCVLIAMRIEPQYSGTQLEKTFLHFVPMTLGGRLSITPPEGSLSGLPSLSRQINAGHERLLMESKRILRDSGRLSSGIDRRQLSNLYWIRSCPHCQAATQIKFTAIPTVALIKGKGAYTTSEREDLDRFLLSHPDSEAFHYSLSCPSCDIRLAVQLLPQKDSGYYMAKWAVDASNKAAETPLIPFGDTGTYFNHLTASKSLTRPTTDAAREAIREAARAQAQEAADKEFLNLNCLAPSVQYEKVKRVSDRDEGSFAVFNDQVGRLAPSIDKHLFWTQESKIYKDSLMSIEMNVWLDLALRANGHDVNYWDHLEVPMGRFVAEGWLFNKWQGNYNWKKQCPAADCQSRIKVNFTPIPYEAIDKYTKHEMSTDEKDRRTEYMLRYHWNDTDDRHPSWVVQCPQCNVKIKAKLNRGAFASYDLTSWGVADQRDVEENFLDSGAHGFHFGPSWAPFNQFTLRKFEANVEEA